MKEPNKEFREIWQKIKDFKLDEDGIVLPFSKKLAKENNWSVEFTQRAIEEYKKFILLCIISPNGASPSHIVDLVWHLHLTYTRSYWEDFCGKTLRKSIHHHPSKGGGEEKDKHVNWYANTLELYALTFGEAPPAVIWPPANNNNSREISTDINFSISFNFIKQKLLLFILPFALIFMLYDQANPFLLAGEHFLVFYLFLSLLLFQ